MCVTSYMYLPHNVATTSTLADTTCNLRRQFGTVGGAKKAMNAS